MSTIIQSFREFLATALFGFLFWTLFTFQCLAQSAFAPGVNFIEEIVYQGLPVTAGIAFGPGDRLFLAIKEGSISVAVGGKLLPQPFVSIPEIVNKSTDRGLLAVAVHPQFPTKPFVYAAFVYDPPEFQADAPEPRVSRVVRWTADAAQEYNVAVPGSMQVILGRGSTAQTTALAPAGRVASGPEPASCMSGLTSEGTPVEDCIPADGLSHSVGSLEFGPDGSLYASFGDGADYDRPNRTALRVQNIDSMSGRIVRVNPDTGAGLLGNPFFDSINPFSNRSRLWLYGLRNPFRITIDPASGQAFAGDVGTSYFEEVNVGKGANFGWPCYEGGLPLRSQQEGGATVSLPQVGYSKDSQTKEICQGIYDRGAAAVVSPLFTYRHKYDANKKDLGASITGLAFYSGDSYPQPYRGALFIGDYAQRWIRYVKFGPNSQASVHDFAQEVGSNLGVVQLLSGPDKNIYAVYIDLKTRTSQVRRFRPGNAGNAAPVVMATANPKAGGVPLAVSFRSDGTYDPEGKNLRFMWNFGDGTVSYEANPMHVFTKAGTFSVDLTVSELDKPESASMTSFVIRSGLTPPQVIIDSPLPSQSYAIGDTIALSGRVLGGGGPSTLSWSVLQRHNQHEHLVAEVQGPTGSFKTEEHTDDTAYEVCLAATTDEDLQDQRCVVLKARHVPYTLKSEPVGATISYIDEGVDLLAPTTTYPIERSVQTIAAAVGHRGMSFAGWSDGVASLERTFTVGRNPKTLTALYANRPPIVTVRVQRIGGRLTRKVRLDARGSKDPEGAGVRYIWRFHDRTRSTRAVLRKEFARTARYTATLTVIDALGASTSKRFAVDLRR